MRILDRKLGLTQPPGAGDHAQALKNGGAVAK